MDPNLVWIGVAIVALLVIAAIIFLVTQRQRSAAIREKFGEEYDHAVTAAGGNRARAEEQLLRRAERVREYDVRPLSAAERDRFAQDWRAIQNMFVDQPETAVQRADKVISEVMSARGYPVGDFEQRTSDISVGHGDVVRDYRIAHGLTIAHESGAGTTENLRQAMVHYRTIFDELVSEGAAERTIREEEGRDRA